MGFLNWFQSNQEESDSQLNLLGESQQLSKRERVDSAEVHKDFQKAIKNSGGSQDAYPASIKAETQELFDCDVNTLYQITGGKKSDRSTLPKEVQKAYMASEIRSTHELNQSSFYSNTDQDQVDQQIVETVKESARQTRKWLPW